MTVEELFKLFKACDDAELHGHAEHVSLVSPDSLAPVPRRGWPKGELLRINRTGSSVWVYNAERLSVTLLRNLGQ